MEILVGIYVFVCLNGLNVLLYKPVRQLQDKCSYLAVNICILQTIHDTNDTSFIPEITLK